VSAIVKRCDSFNGRIKESLDKLRKRDTKPSERVVYIDFRTAYADITQARFKFTEFCDLIADKSDMHLADVMKMGRSEFLYLVAKFVARELAERKAAKQREQHGRRHSSKVSHRR